MEIQRSCYMGVNYSEVIEKMRWAGKLKNDSAVARKLSVTPQALSNYKKRGEMPSNLVLKFSKMYGLSMDWLITGEGTVQKPGSTAPRVLPAGMEGDLTPYPATGATRVAAEETAPYAKWGSAPGREIGHRLSFAVLGPDETIYVGKLLKILRGKNASNASAIRYTIDAFLKSTGSTRGAASTPGTDQPGEQED